MYTKIGVRGSKFIPLSMMLFMAVAMGSEPPLTTIRPLESRASENTKSKIAQLFSEAREIEFRFVPLRDIELRAYRPNFDSMPYSYLFRCDDRCATVAHRLKAQLSTAILAEGQCPWITAVIVFRRDANNELSRLSVGAKGRCLVAFGKTYVLNADDSLSNYLERYPDVHRSK